MTNYIWANLGPAKVNPPAGVALYYCGEDGNDASDGTSWATRKATITGLLAISYNPGDYLIVGPGVYRETTTLNRNGKTITEQGSLSVTEGSKIVTGTSTNWDPAVRPGDMLNIPWLAYGTTGTGTGCTLDGAGGLQSNGGANDAEFQANLVGFCVNVQTRGSYLVATVVDSDDITLTDINSIGWAVGGPFNFWIPSNEGSYEIESVDSDTQITLRRPWSGPTYTWTNDRYKGGSGTYGTGYIIFRPVHLIGDETGILTDGIGGICRITGSDNDLGTRDRNYCIYGNGRNYWSISGFQVDTADIHNIHLDGARYITLEDIRSISPDEQHIYLLGRIDGVTVRRCAFFGGNFNLGIFDLSRSFAIKLRDSLMRWTEYGLHVENCLFDCDYGVGVDNYANVTIKSCTSGMQFEFGVWTTSVDLGGSVFVHDCEWHYSTNAVMWAGGAGHEIVANWNNFWDNNSTGSGWTWGAGTKGPNSTEYCYIPEMPILVDNYRYPVRFYPPSQWWAPAQHTGLYPANEDIYGIPRTTLKTNRSLGCYQDDTVERDTVVTYGGEEASLKHPDARRTQFRIPISGDPVTVTVQVQYESNYVGTLPSLVVAQAGQVEVEDIAEGAADAWEQLSVSFVPAAVPKYLWAELVSNNTAAGAGIAVYWQRLSVIPEIT